MDDILVTTFAVVWIEILGIAIGYSIIMSPPSRWCGLKSVYAMSAYNDSRHHLRGGVD